MSVNKVILVGRLGRPPELRYTQQNKAVTDLRVATDHSWTDGGGQRQTKTEWSTVVVWGKDAENCERYLTKGSQVYVEGRLETREWVDAKDGQKRYKTEVIAERVQFLGGKGEGGGGGGGSRPEGGGGGRGVGEAPQPGGHQGGEGGEAQRGRGTGDSDRDQGRGDDFGGSGPEDDIPF